jgi:uncharacterized tellurite resistance protein B-like protein
MDAYRQVALTLAESLVMIAAVDGRIHTREQAALLKALKEVWLPNYGSQKSALVAAFHNAKLVHDFGLDVSRKMRTHAELLSKIFTEKEKASFMQGAMEMILADGEPDSAEIRLYNILNEHLKPSAGLMSSLKSTVAGWFGKS